MLDIVDARCNHEVYRTMFWRDSVCIEGTSSINCTAEQCIFSFAHVKPKIEWKKGGAE